MSAKPVVIWLVHDDKPGHRNQLRGLTNALAMLVWAEVHEVRPPSRGSALAAIFSKHLATAQQLPAPDLILGAGHATHLAVLAARRAYGGKAIVLMKPSLPTHLFDLCLVPEHDGLPESSSVLQTRGVLNVIQPSSSHDQHLGLMLVGGPSAAHSWSDKAMVEQIVGVAAGSPETSWVLSTSRRTPPAFLEMLATHHLDNLKAVPHEQTTPAWVPEQLARSSQVWVSEDSVSMVYEALTSGAAVGLLEVPSTKRGRVAAGVDALIDEGWVTRFSDWQAGARLSAPPEQLDEAQRCAKVVVDRFLRQAAA